MKRCGIGIVVGMVVMTGSAYAGVTTYHTQNHYGDSASRTGTRSCSFATGVVHRADLRMTCSRATGRAVASYTFHITGLLMGTPTFHVSSAHASGVKVSTTVTHPTASTVRVTVVATGRGSDTIRSVSLAYATC
jgi:hypothetical protein